MPDDPHGSSGDPSVEGQQPHDGTNGARITGGQTRPVSFDDLAEPVDLVAVQADDELINALAAGMSVSSPGASGYDADDRVTAILAAWKADVDAAPLPDLVDVDTGVSTVLAARPSSRGRHLAPVAAAAAFLVLVIGGVSVTSYNAEPDDVLWGVSKVLYSERAESVEAAARVEERIDSAKQALVAGQPARAAEELADAETDLAAVRPQEGQDELAEAQDFLEAKAAETPPGRSVDPAAPLATQPSRPVPESVREPRPSSPESTAPGTSGSSTNTSENQQSPTSQPEPGSGPGSDPGSGQETGPEVASTPGGNTDSNTPAQPTNDPRRAQVAPPQDSGTAPTSSPTQPDGSGEGEPEEPTQPSDSSTATATPEGRPEATTTSPAPPPSSGGGGGETPESTGPSAAGAEPAPAN